MSFWRTFSWQSQSAIDTIIETGNFTLEDLLNENEILSELKTQNKGLIEFLILPETLHKLVYYITNKDINEDNNNNQGGNEEDEEDEESNNSAKYPYLCCEILCSEIWSISEAIFSDETLLDDLFKYLDNEELDPILAAYVSKFAGVLLGRRFADVVKYLQTKDQIIVKIINHIHISSIMEFLFKIIGSEDQQAELDIQQWLCDSNLISSLIDKINIQNKPAVYENASQTLLSIIMISLQSPGAQFAEPPALLRTLESEECVTKLLENTLKDPCLLLQGLPIIVEIIRNNSVEPINDSPLEDLPAVIRLVASKFETLLELASVDPNDPTIETTFGVIQPYGRHRMQVLEVFTAMIKARYRFIIETLLFDHDFFNFAFDLFFKYEWNNFLHNLVAQMAFVLLTDCEHDDKLMGYMFEKLQLHARLAKVGIENDEQNIRKGYMGFVTKLTDSVNNVSGVNKTIRTILSENEDWNEYLENDYAKITKINSTTMGANNEPEPDDYDDPIEESPMVSNMIAKQGFYDDFPDDFAAGEFDDDLDDILYNPDNRFIENGFITDEKNFGKEFDDDLDDILYNPDNRFIENGFITDEKNFGKEFDDEDSDEMEDESSNNNEEISV
eukprot:TRINITY_DN12949_c0_g4_i1.p1 TRINITY_DN12949_c0_g4~~TRINITY_DN12949_c0_g4_i1.p1  ORF type:complete len:616 (+),score=222.89 TRINITY_DN12949_c0_g4_i1:88-1935(+)